MNVRELLLILVGGACLGWGGSSVAAGAATVDARAVNLAIFAIGVVLLAQMPAVRLAARVRALEEKRPI